jgi:hypothetical protein
MTRTNDVAKWQAALCFEMTRGLTIVEITIIGRGIFFKTGASVIGRVISLGAASDYDAATERLEVSLVVLLKGVYKLFGELSLSSRHTREAAGLNPGTDWQPNGEPGS